MRHQRDLGPSLDVTIESNRQEGVSCQAAKTDKGVCISHVSVAVIESHDQKQVKETFNLVFSSRELESGMAGAVRHGSRSRKLVPSHSVYTEEAQTEQEVG